MPNAQPAAGGAARWCRPSLILVVARLRRVAHGVAVDRGPLVRLGRLPQRLHHRAGHQGPAVRRRLRPHRRASSASSLVIAYRTRPIYAPVTAQQQNLDQYREAIEPLRRIAMIAIPAVLGLLAGHRRGRAVEDLPAVAQPRSRSAPRTRSSAWTCRFFVFTLPWIQFVARLPHHGAGHGAHRRRLHALRLRRPADPVPRRAHHAAPPGRTSRSCSRRSSWSGRPTTGSTATRSPPRTPRCSPASATPTPTPCCRPRRSSRSRRS